MKRFQSFDITSFDAVIVAVGEDLASILTSLTLKNWGQEDGCRPRATCMARYWKIGVDIVVHPERDMGIRLARTLVSNSIIEQIDLSAIRIWNCPQELSRAKPAKQLPAA